MQARRQNLPTKHERPSSTRSATAEQRPGTHSLAAAQPMASLTMMASFAAVAAATPSRRGSFAVARTAKVERCQQEPARLQAAEEARPADGRRAVMLAAAVAAIGGAGVASAEPKKGTPEAKKKYASICVTMPTAKICHN